MDLDTRITYQLSPKGVALAKAVFKEQRAMHDKRVAFMKKYKAKSLYTLGKRVCSLGVIYKDKKGKPVEFIIPGETTPVLPPGWRLDKANSFQMRPDLRTPEGKVIAKKMAELTMPEPPHDLVGSSIGFVGNICYRTIVHRVGKRFFVLQAAKAKLIKPKYGKKVRNSFYLRCRENAPKDQEHVLCL